MLDAIKLALASLALLASTTIAGAPVRRSSLFGFEVGGVVLELSDAARVLADSKAPPNAPADLLVAPQEVGSAQPYQSLCSETWRAGPAAKRREAALRRALPSVTRRSGERIVKLSAEAGADRKTIKVVEFTYTGSWRVPPIAPV